ncbi:hypothetical protein ACFV47_37995 [Streptomyces solisilvae]|uniref:hypothetical protein n=1 Tax=Streptomyces malaysiensis TaxID=92644 RepID=UPI00367F5B8D
MGRRLGAWTVWEILQKAGIDPALQRTNQSWPVFLKAQASAIVATDLFHIDTVFLRRWFVLFFIDRGTAACTSPASPGTRPAPGSPSKRGTTSWTSVTAQSRSDSSSGTAAPTSPTTSTPSSRRKAYV